METKPLAPQQQAPDTSPKPKISNGKQVLIVSGVIGFFILIIAFASSGGNKAPSAGVADSPATQTPSPSPSVDPTAKAVAAWFSQYRPKVSALVDDFTSMSNDASNGNVSAIGADCRKIQSDVTSAQEAPAVPDSELEKDWSTGLSDYGSGARACITGINDNDVNLITQASTEISHGDDALNHMAASIATLSK